MSDVGATGLPERPKGQKTSRRARWVALPSDGREFLDRKMTIEARSPDWRDLAKLSALLESGLKNSIPKEREANLSGFRINVFIEFYSRDRPVVEALATKALKEAGYAAGNVQRIHATRGPAPHVGNGKNPIDPLDAPEPEGGDAG